MPYQVMTLKPIQDSTLNLGDSSYYWKYGYIDRVYLNGTAYLDGATAGTVGVSGNLSVSGELSKFKVAITAKATNYTVTAAETGTIFTTAGASGAVQFTLPTAADGLYYLFVNAVNQNMTITYGTGDKIITFNDAAADSVAFSTTNEKIGAVALAFSDGTNWYVINLSPNTATVST